MEAKIMGFLGDAFWVGLGLTFLAFLVVLVVGFAKMLFEEW